LWGSVFFFIGVLITLILVISKIVDPQTVSITNKPGFYLALTALIIGMQMFLAGFISELIVRNAPGRNWYLIEEKMGL
jgi:uncharacterized membrane protein